MCDVQARRLGRYFAKMCDFISLLWNDWLVWLLERTTKTHENTRKAVALAKFVVRNEVLSAGD